MPVGTVARTQTVYSGTISATPLQIARDFLEGYTGDYYFFRCEEDAYILVLSDNWDSETLSCTDCDLFMIGYERYTGTTSTYITYYAKDFGAFSVSNVSGYLAYSSEEGYPHLIEGVQNYGLLQVLLLCGIIVFGLADRIFRHIR